MIYIPITYNQGYKIKRNEKAGHVPSVRVVDKFIRDFAGETRREEATCKTQRRWEDNVTTNLKEMEWQDVNWIQLSQDRDNWRNHMNTETSFDSKKCGEFCEQLWNCWFS